MIVQKQRRTRNSPYEEWRRGEGVPTLGAGSHSLPDIHGDLELEPWPRKGVRGAFIRLRGGEECMDAYLLELAPGQSTHPERYMFEEQVFVVSGTGSTTVWNTEDRKHSFDWKRGSVFSPPMNAWREHRNESADQPARLLVMSNAPLMFNVVRSTDFIFNCAHAFTDRFDDREGYFSGQGQFVNDNVLEASYVPDVYSMQLRDYSDRGPGGTGVFFDMAGNTIQSHVAEFEVGTYKKAHRHGPGAHILILGGEGFTLLWEDGKPKEKIDWCSGTLFALPDMWFHQHFNTGRERARYFAVHYGDWRFVVEDFFDADVSTRIGGHQIEYEDEDADVLETYLDEMRSRGLEPKPIREWRG